MPAAQMPPTVGGAVPGSRNRLWGALLGVVALVAAAVFAVLLQQKDESSDTAATTAAISTMPTTVAATTIAPTTTMPVIDAATLIAAMPADTEVPADWSRYAEPHQQTDTTGTGICLGPTRAALAAQYGSTADVDGPQWDLPSYGQFGLDVTQFPTESEASAYLLALIEQTNTCLTDPEVWEVSEVETDWIDDPAKDVYMWQVTRAVAANEQPTVNSDQDMRLLDERRYSTPDGDGILVAVKQYICHFERHGPVVIEFWIKGSWGESGWSSFRGAYQPTDADLDAAADVVRAGIVTRLAEAGAL